MAYKIKQPKTSHVVITDIKNKKKYLKRGYKVNWIKEDTISMEK